MLPQRHRLTKQRDFAVIWEQGKTKWHQDLLFRYKPNLLTHSRFAIIVSRKVSKKAVVRNKLKRRLREIIRKHVPHLPTGYDVIIVTKNSLLTYSFSQLETLVVKQLTL